MKRQCDSYMGTGKRMKFNYGFPALLISSAVVLVTPQLALSLSQVQVDKIAREITVRIDGDGSGSGWIYEHKGDVYYVVTNSHVVATDNGKYKIRTNDGESHDAAGRSLGRSDLDLAVLQFVSKKQYSVANLGNSDQIKTNTTVYAVGWAESFEKINPLREKKTAYSVSQTKSTSNTNERGYEFQPGNILNLLQNPIGQGYRLMYDNQVDPGMSGGPLLDENGRVIGINGLGIEFQTGYVRLGIPINSFLAARNNFQPLTQNSPTITKQPNSTRTDTRQQSAESLISLGGAKIYKGDYQGAIADYNLALQINPNNPDIYYQRGIAYFNLNNTKAALDDFNQVIRLNPKNYRGYVGRGNAYGNKKEYDRAIADFNQALKLNSNYAKAYIGRGNAYYYKGDYNSALVNQNQALKLDPNDAAAYNGRGWAYYAKGDYDRAIADQNQALKLDPTYTNSYDNRGLAYYGKKDYDRAISDYSQVVRLDPKYTDAYYNRGLAYFDKKDYDHAIADYSQALKLNPNYADAYYNRGLTYFDKKDYDRAIADYSQALRFDPSAADAYYNRGLAYADKGSKDLAIKDFKKVIELNNDKDLILRAQEQLQELASPSEAPH